jgi:hypothetical protein
LQSGPFPRKLALSLGCAGIRISNLSRRAIQMKVLRDRLPHSQIDYDVLLFVVSVTEDGETDHLVVGTERKKRNYICSSHLLLIKRLATAHKCCWSAQEVSVQQI